MAQCSGRPVMTVIFRHFLGLEDEQKLEGQTRWTAAIIPNGNEPFVTRQRSGANFIYHLAT